MTNKCTFLLLLIAAALSMPGCAAWSTYPAIPGALQVGHPEVEPLPTIMAEAVRYSNERYLEMEEPVFNLPKGVTVATYESVKRRLRGGVAMREPGERAVHVTQIRTRGPHAEVDIVYPRSDGHYQLVTLNMRQRVLNRFHVESTRLWRIRVDVPEPSYPQPDEPEQHSDENVAAQEHDT